MAQTKYYFDYTAATPILDELVPLLKKYSVVNFYNPSAVYLPARDNKKDLENFRSVIAQGIGAKANEIVFTAGGTEANNLAIQGFMHNYPQGNVVISAVEHESVLKPAFLFKHSVAPVTKTGVVDLTKLTELIDDNTVLISVMYANNEIGAIQPIKKIAQMVRNILSNRKSNKNLTPLFLHTDACQASNYLDMQVSRLGVDMMTINSGKLYGPKQCGALYVRTGTVLHPIILGGGQERGLRSGTENLANIAGFAGAWQIIRQDYQKEARRLTNLRDEFINNLVTRLPKVTVNGPSGSDRLANNINCSIAGVKDTERLVMLLDEAGFMVAGGSACSALSNKPSQVLRAIGQPDGGLRISLGRYTSKKDLDNLLKALIKIVEIL